MKGKLFFLLGLGIFSGIFLFFVVRILWTQVLSLTNIFTPQSISFTLAPPHSAVTASISGIKGTVEKEGRQDTKFMKITKPTTLLESEEIAVGNKGSVTATFPSVTTAVLSAYAELDYLNGLPNALVIRQPNGTIDYTTAQAIEPFSVRTLGLLVEWQKPVAVSISTDATNQTVLVKVTKGSVILAYSDANNATQVNQLVSGDYAFFEYTTSTLTIY